MGFIVLVIAGGTSSFSVDQKRVSETVLQKLKEYFFLQEAVELAEKHGDRATAKKYFAARKDKFGFTGSESQGQMVVDGYHVRSESSVIGLSLFFHGDQEVLVMVNVTIHPSAEQEVHSLIKQSLDAVDAPGRGPSRKAKLYFLGLQPLKASKVLKIMVREDILSKGSVYSINYAISYTQ